MPLRQYRIKRLTIFAAVSVALLVASWRARAAEAPVPFPKLDDAVARGLDYLAKQQNPDGSFAAGRNPDGTPATTVSAPPCAVTGMTLMAFLSAGDVPDLGRRGPVLSAAIEYLLTKVPEDGYIGAAKGDKGDDSRMYGHGVVTLALAQAYGVEHDRNRRQRIRVALGKMLGVILRAQAVQKPEAEAGGWRYAPDAANSDLSVTTWNVLALRACRDAGFDVPNEAFDRATQYVIKCRNAADKGFSYQPGSPSQPGTTAMAIVSLRVLSDDVAARPELPEAYPFLAQAASNPAAVAPAKFPCVTTYHVVQAAQIAGEPTWAAVSAPAFDALLKSQAPDGGWPPSTAAAEPGRVYASAMAVLTLTVPYRLLPAYER